MALPYRGRNSSTGGSSSRGTLSGTSLTGKPQQRRLPRWSPGRARFHLSTNTGRSACAGGARDDARNLAQRRLPKFNWGKTFDAAPECAGVRRIGIRFGLQQPAESSTIVRAASVVRTSVSTAVGSNTPAPPAMGTDGRTCPTVGCRSCPPPPRHHSRPATSSW